MTLYDIFAGMAILAGVVSSTFLTVRAFANRKNRSLFVNLLVLALCGFWVAGVYIFTLGSAMTTTLTIGVYIRPAIILLLLIPSLIVWDLKI
jgi:hypothetical protein